jgi:outer membrane protein X
MKYIFVAALLIAGLSFVSSTNLNAQASEGAMRVGGQLGYGTEIESLGIGARFDYAITEQILLAPDLMYFFGKSEGSLDYNWFDINLNGNYLFDIGSPDIVPYALAGLNFAIVSVDYDTGGSPIDGDSSSTEVGFNLGGGADFLVGALTVFGELRFVLGDADQLVIAGGVKFPIN